MNKGINVFSGFDGIGGGRIGIERAGITPDHYFASEIEESSIRIAMYNHPDIIQLSDINKIKIKTIYLSEAYNYLCKKYFNGNIQSLQSIISEREMLHRINEEENFSAYFGTQEPIKNRKPQSNTFLSINDRIWFWKNPMGDFKGLYDIIRSGDRREIPNTLNVGKLCKHSFWWNGNGQYESRTEETSIERTIRKKSNRKIERKDPKNIDQILFNNRSKRTLTNECSETISRSSKKEELSGRNSEIRSNRNGIEKKENSGNQTSKNVSEITEVLHTSNERVRAINDDRDISNLYKKIQITVVECEWGLVIFKGKINITLAGSPCQSFSNAGPRSGFNGKSGLFWEYTRIQNEVNPKYWLLENVEMKKEWEKVLSNILGVPAIHINSSLVSGQNRPRIYLTNIPYTPIIDKKIMLGDDVLGAVCGTNKHGKLVPEHLRVIGRGGKLVKYKANGWIDMVDLKGCCLTTKRGYYKNVQGKVIGYTPENAEYLQRLPNGYTNVPGICNTDRHASIGNGWTVDVLVEAFFKNLPWASKMISRPRSFQKIIK